MFILFRPFVRSYGCFNMCQERVNVSLLILILYGVMFFFITTAFYFSISDTMHEHVCTIWLTLYLASGE